jgi:hypothetical protein
MTRLYFLKIIETYLKTYRISSHTIIEDDPFSASSLIFAKCGVSSGFFSLDKFVELEISSVLPSGNQTCSTENPSTIYSFLFPIKTHIYRRFPIARFAYRQVS